MKNIIKKARITIKSMKESVLFIMSFIFGGNKKLTDYDNAETGVKYRYAQFNLPARKTCPHATKDCYKFCYAKRDERHTSVKNNRLASLEASKRDNFAECMIHTIKTAFMTLRYKGACMILRIHESGDFYNLAYLKKWIQVFGYFENADYSIIFCFYTKCFEYLLSLSETEKALFRRVTDSGLVSCSLSLDKSSTPEQIARAMKLRELFPAVNVYFAIPEKEIDSIVHDSVCDCADCAKCGKCVHADGKIIACAIH